MDSISEIANTAIVPGALSFYNSALASITENPAGSAILFALAALAALLTRSILILIAMSFLCVLTLLASNDADDAETLATTAIGAASLLIFCVWTIALRRRLARLNTRLRSSLKDHAKTKELLDREIAWRQASEDNS